MVGTSPESLNQWSKHSKRWKIQLWKFAHIGVAIKGTRPDMFSNGEGIEWEHGELILGLWGIVILSWSLQSLAELCLGGSHIQSPWVINTLLTNCTFAWCKAPCKAIMHHVLQAGCLYEDWPWIPSYLTWPLVYKSTSVKGCLFIFISRKAEPRCKDLSFLLFTPR